MFLSLFLVSFALITPVTYCDLPYIAESQFEKMKRKFRRFMVGNEDRR